jgi:hypothetical protein
MGLEDGVEFVEGLAGGFEGDERIRRRRRRR